MGGGGFLTFYFIVVSALPRLSMNTNLKQCGIEEGDIWMGPVEAGLFPGKSWMLVGGEVYGEGKARLIVVLPCPPLQCVI